MLIRSALFKPVHEYWFVGMLNYFSFWLVRLTEPDHELKSSESP